MTRETQRIVERGGRPEAVVLPRPAEHRPGARLGAGAVAGFLAGLAMALWIMALYDALGLGFSAPLREMAALVAGPGALIGSWWMILLGAAIHAAGAVAIGVAFSALLPADAPLGLATGFGVALGGAAFLVVMYLLAPWLDETLRMRLDLLTGPWLGGYLVFGALLGALTWLVRKRTLADVVDVEVAVD